MIETFVFTFALIILAIAGLATSLFFGRSALRGSCGGIACVKSIKCAGCPRANGGVS